MKINAKIFFVFSVGLAVSALMSTYSVYSQVKPVYIGSKGCLTCHPIKNKKIEKTIEQWNNHEHAKLKNGCETCHGKGNEHAALGTKKLLSLKKNKGDLKIIVNKTSKFCGECHKRTKDNSILLHSSDLIMGNQQYTEMLYNKKAQLKMTCLFCHDAHAGSKSKEGISRECLDCHKGKYKIEVKIPAMADLECESCHMPYASRNASDTMIREYHRGDALSHIFGISVDPDYKLDNGSGQVALNGEGFARLTVEMTCYACHKSGKTREISRDQLLKMAKKIH